MSNVDRVWELQKQMTMTEGGEVPGAKKVFDEFYRLYGLTGIEALCNAGYNNPEKLWDFYLICYSMISSMAQRLDLEK